MEKTKADGLKLTPQRLAIFDYLRDNTDHPSAEDIFAAVSKKFPTMSVATVYNTLETLRKRGEVLTLTIDPGKRRFDPNPKPHNHLTCVRCRRIIDVHTEFQLTVPDRERAEFEIIGNHVEFYGICGRCRRTRRNRAQE
jgi:Fur family transcriptional regulator, peroxide stress response regulator